MNESTDCLGEILRASQLRLFPAHRPLVERLGVAFFRSAPKQPGVYWFSDAGGRVLYVGQSRNLHRRLQSYRHAQPGRVPSKIIRLVHEADQLAIETCATPEAAVLRENELIRLHRPKFNRANTWPKSNGFVRVERRQRALVLVWTSDASKGDPTMVFGAFRNSARFAMAALARLHWVARNPDEGWDKIPSGMLGQRPAKEFILENADSMLETAVMAFLRGESDELVDLLGERQPRASDSFWVTLEEADCDILRQFFLRGPQRVRRWLGPTGESRLLSQESLDDFTSVEALRF